MFVVVVTVKDQEGTTTISEPWTSYLNAAAVSEPVDPPVFFVRFYPQVYAVDMASLNAIKKDHAAFFLLSCPWSLCANRNCFGPTNVANAWELQMKHLQGLHIPHRRKYKW